MALATNGVARVTTDWQGGAHYSTDPGDFGGTDGKSRFGGHYASDGVVGYIPQIWAGKLISSVNK